MVNWILLEEEETLGFVNLNGKKIFLVEIAQRFDAPAIFIFDSLKEAILKFCFLDPEDLDNEEEKECFDRIYKEAEEEMKKAESKEGVNYD